MANEHPDRELLERFLGDELAADERRAVVRHLLTGCPQCTEVTRQLWSLTGGPQPAPPTSAIAPRVTHPSSYRGLFERVARRGRQRERELAAEREEAPRLAARLLRTPAAKRRALAAADPRLASSALVDLLVYRSEEGALDAAVGPVELAELALAIAERLDPQRCGAGVVRELVLRAWAALGAAHRLGGDLGAAERALGAAEALLDGWRDAGEPAGERPRLLVLAGTLAGDHGHLEAAGALLARAVAAARMQDEPRLLARALIERGLALAAAGQLEAAAQALREGTDPQVEPEDPRLLAAGLDRLTDLAATLGRGEEAARHLVRLRRLAARRPEMAEASGPRQRWLAGKIAVAAERPAEAEAAFLEAGAGLLALGRGRDAALAALDLAVLYLRAGRWGELQRLAGEIYPVFTARDMQREALMSLLVFRRAAESETVSVELLVEIARYLTGFAPGARTRAA